MIVDKLKVYHKIYYWISRDLQFESDSDLDLHDWIDAEQMALGKIKNDQLRKQDEIRRMEKAHNFLAEAVRKRAPAENLTSIE